MSSARAIARSLIDCSARCEPLELGVRPGELLPLLSLLLNDPPLGDNFNEDSRDSDEIRSLGDGNRGEEDPCDLVDEPREVTDALLPLLGMLLNDPLPLFFTESL